MVDIDLIKYFIASKRVSANYIVKHTDLSLSMVYKLNNNPDKLDKSQINTIAELSNLLEDLNIQTKEDVDNIRRKEIYFVNK